MVDEVGLEMSVVLWKCALWNVRVAGKVVLDNCLRAEEMVKGRRIVNAIVRMFVGQR